MKLINFYASGPVCSPTRAGLLTGRYQQRAGIPGVVYAAPDRNRHHGLQLTEYTFAEAFRDAGYKTGMFGKWHLGYKPQYNPIHHGFDEFRGYVSGNVDYQSHVDQAGFYDWWSQDQLVNEPGYVTHLITKHAVDFIERNHAHPFVLYLPHEAPHYPFQGPEDEGFRIVHQQIPEQRDSAQVVRAYREMVQALDAGVGAVMESLEQLGIAENTMVLFFSDNGASRFGSNGPFRGFKGSLWEGGIRVPAVAWWKGKIAAASQSTIQSITLDIFPTLLSLAGLQTQETSLDGIDLSPTLINNAPMEPRILYWEYVNQRAIQTGPWKLLINDEEQARLFNIKNDPGEKHDLSALQPERVKSMRALHKDWQKEVTQNATPQPDN